jgi:hypothetical protein
VASGDALQLGFHTDGTNSAGQVVSDSARAGTPGAQPDWRRTLHCIGDLHAGAITPARFDAVSRDLARLRAPALHLQVGDATERGDPREDELALEFLERLPGPWAVVLGNHDILRNARGVDDWARAYGQRSQNYTIDLDFARVIVVGPNRVESGQRAGRLSLATLAFLDRVLERGPENCWIACHWPLFHTVMGDPRRHFTSTMSAFYAKPDERIRELLAARPNARVWLSGHTHSPLSAPALIKRVRLGRSRSIVAINGSALVGVGKRRDPRDPLCSLFLTQRAGRIQLRCRDHRAGGWRRLQGRPVVEIST